MQEAQDSTPNENVLANEVEGSLGFENQEAPGEDSPANSDEESSSGSHSKETLAVQKRLKSQKRAHEREVRELHARIGDLETRMSQPKDNSNSQPTGSYDMPEGNDIDGQIHKAVSYALRAKEAEERKAKEAEGAQQVQRHYQGFQKHLDGLNDKYDDSHEVLFGDTPYTPAMRDYALTLPRSGAGSAGEVLYKLGKNPDELKRIAKLHPLDQASEMAKLSHALVSGGEGKGSDSKPPLGNIKSNPVTNSHAVTEKTSVSDLRKRMKDGWK